MYDTSYNTSSLSMWRKGPFTNFLTPAERFSSRRNSHESNGYDNQELPNTKQKNAMDVDMSIHRRDDDSVVDDFKDEVDEEEESQHQLSESELRNKPKTEQSVANEDMRSENVMGEILKSLMLLSEKLDSVSQCMLHNETRLDNLTDLVESIKLPSRELHESIGDLSAVAQDVHASKDSLLATSKKLEQHILSFECQNRKLGEQVDKMPEQTKQTTSGADIVKTPIIVNAPTVSVIPLTQETKTTDLAGRSVNGRSETDLSKTGRSKTGRSKTGRSKTGRSKTGRSKIGDLKADHSKKGRGTLLEEEEEEDREIQHQSKTAATISRILDPDIDIFDVKTDPRKQSISNPLGKTKSTRSRSSNAMESLFTLPLGLKPQVEPSSGQKSRKSGASKRKSVPQKAHLDPDEQDSDEDTSWTRSSSPVNKLTSQRSKPDSGKVRIILQQSGPNENEY